MIAHWDPEVWEEDPEMNQAFARQILEEEQVELCRRCGEEEIESCGNVCETCRDHLRDMEARAGLL
jgi:recombinational DNA repair protein RecR